MSRNTPRPPATTLPTASAPAFVEEAGALPQHHEPATRYDVIFATVLAATIGRHVGDLDRTPAGVAMLTKRAIETTKTVIDVYNLHLKDIGQ